jgi:hypothetical protein
VIFPSQGGDPEASQFVDGRGGPTRIGRGIPDHQLEASAADAAGSVDVVRRQFEPGQQVTACFDPAGPGEGNESADPEGDIDHVSLAPPPGGRCPMLPP